MKIKGWITLIGALVGVLLVIQVVTGIGGMFGYYLDNVRSDEVGIKFDQNQPVEILGPGVYSDFGPQNMFRYKGIVTIKVNAIPFQMSDEEVLTKDKQRLGVLIQGTVRRPGVADPHVLLANWATYRQFYEHDDVLLGTTGKDNKHIPGLMDNLGNQAAKVCIGDKNFDDAVIGSARDILSECIYQELGRLAHDYGLTVSNIVVPNVILSKPVQEQLDAITQARLATQLAGQRQEQNTAEAKQEAAKQAGAITVEQGKIQERAKQDAKTAELQVTALNAQRSQIEAEKNNQLYAAQRDKNIADAQREAAQLKAQADLAPEIAKAQMLQANPNYVELQKVQAMANAYKSTDKVMVLPAGSSPITVLGDSGKSVVIPAASTESGSPSR